MLWYGVLYLTRDGEPVCFVCALDDASDALDGTHELCEFVRVQVGDARDGARRTHEHVYNRSTVSILQAWTAVDYGP